LRCAVDRTVHEGSACIEVRILWYLIGSIVNQAVNLTLLIAVLAQFSCGLRPDRVTFQAKVADLRRPGNSFARNKRPDDLVEITLPGRLLEVPAAVKLVERRETDWSTPESAVAAILSANVTGDVPWILQSFVPAERNGALKQFADPVAVERGRESYAAMGKFEITGQAELHGITLVFVRGEEEDGDSTVLTVNLSKTPSGWKQTDALAQDDTLDVISIALHTGTVK
jgi:hypothetical protein